MNEPLHVYSAMCSWHDNINKVGKTKGPISIPCCPYCGGVLYQMPEHEWWNGALAHEKAGHTNYEKFLRWTMTQEKCWPTLEKAAEDYTKLTGNEVKLR